MSKKTNSGQMELGLSRESDMKKGWLKKTIGEMCKVTNGGTPKTGVSEYWGGKHLWITPAEMGKRLSPYVSDTERKITDLGLRDSSAQMLPPNSVILSSRAPIGHLVINTELMATNQGCKGLIPGSQLHHKFLYFYLSSIVDLLNSLGSGATFKELSGGKLKEVTIPVPPLPEQKRIVGILDEAFDGIATAKANAEKNLQNARAIFESHLESVFTQSGEGWVERKLSEWVQDISTGPFGSLLHKSDYEHGEIPLINPINIEGDKIISDQRKAVGKVTAQRLSRYALQENDIVIGRRGEIGRCAVVARNQAGWLCGTGCFIIRPSDKIYPHFLTHLLRSRPYRELLEGVSKRATMPSISNDDLANLVIRLPSLTIQRRTLELLDNFSLETQRLESIYQKKLDALGALKKSLLNQAFTGEL
jgi:type I restriction enzyme S subunit